MLIILCLLISFSITDSISRLLFASIAIYHDQSVLDSHEKSIHQIVTNLIETSSDKNRLYNYYS